MTRRILTVVEALERAHAELHRELQHLEGATRSPSATLPITWVVRLEKVRTALAQHFRMEEHDGYLDAVLNREPHLHHKVEALLEDHRQLLRALEQLLAKAEAAATLDGGFGAEVCKWLQQVRQHESRENAIVQEAFNVSIAAED